MSRIRGPIALLDTLSSDGRRLESGGAQLPTDWVPLMAVEQQDARLGHHGAEIVGRIRFSIEGRELRLEGEVLNTEKVPPGKYSGGLDTRVLADRWIGEEDDTDRIWVVERWEPMAATLHLGRTGSNSFDVEDLEVTA